MRPGKPLRLLLVAALLLTLLCDNAFALAHEFRLNYITVDAEFMAAVRGLISSDAKAVHIGQTDSIVVSGTQADINSVGELLSMVDRKPGQILIEARIVEVSKSHSRQLGVSWEAGHMETGREVLGRPGVVDGSFAVNLPTSSESGGTLGFGYVTSRDSLDMRISALEQEGHARIVSSPSIQVMENQRAVISEGEEFLVPKSDNSTVINTGELDPRKKPVPETYSAVLELAVKPRITSEAGVALSLEVKREEFDYSKDIKGYPPKISKSARTDLLVASGQTVVIGGITTESSLKSVSGVPLLSRIPILGWLFKGKGNSSGQSELIIFLTPTIVGSGIGSGVGSGTSGGIISGEAPEVATEPTTTEESPIN